MVIALRVSPGGNQVDGLPPAPSGCAEVSRIRVTAGTNLIEGFWNTLKHHMLPQQCRSNMADLEPYLLQGGDPITDLGKVVSDCMAAMDFDPYKNDETLKEITALDDDASDLDEDVGEDGTLMA